MSLVLEYENSAFGLFSELFWIAD